MVALFIGTWLALIGFFLYGLRPYLREVSAEPRDRWTQGL